MLITQVFSVQHIPGISTSFHPFINSEKSKIVLNEFLNLIDEITLTPENVKKLFKDIQLKTGIKGKELYMPIRMKLTGSEHGIEMFNIIDILGKEEVKTRIKYN